MNSAQAGKLKTKSSRKLHNLYLGVDGGGTKTHAVLIDERKNIIGEGFSGTSNPLRVGIETSVDNIFKAITTASDASKYSRTDIVAATFGLAGARREDIRSRVSERILRNLRIECMQVTTDAEIALFGVTVGKEGLVVIAGTGSICIGKNAAGERATAGGWGPLAGDEGGGAGIARRALQAIAKASDGRGKKTHLSQAALDYFRAARMEDLPVAIYAPQIDNAKIAGFAKSVVETACAGDVVASKVVAEAGTELALAANAVIRKLKLEKRKFPVGKVGSIFRAGELITQPFLETIQALAPKAFLTDAVLPPAIAAARMAYETYHRR